MKAHLLLLAAFLSLTTAAVVAKPLGKLTVTVVDADTRQPLGCRVYVREQVGAKWLTYVVHADAANPKASAVPFSLVKPDAAGTEECHTTVSADPFTLELLPEKYLLGVERGKEYRPAWQEITVGEGTATAPAFR